MHTSSRANPLANLADRGGPENDPARHCAPDASAVGAEALPGGRDRTRDTRLAPRYPLNWLLTFSDRSFVEIMTADNYFTFVSYFLLAFGLTFELSLVLTGLVVMGILSPDALRTHRASILIALWTASCFITPGADPYSPLILGVAFTVLFFVNAGLVRFVRPLSAADPIQSGSHGVDVGGSVTVERVA